jgi:Bacterial membrane protein YfhO
MDPSTLPGRGRGDGPVPSSIQMAWRQDTLACAFLAAIVLVLLGGAPLGGAVLAPTDFIFLTPFYSEHVPPNFRAPGNPLLFDQVYQFVPWRQFAWASLREGQLPLWNPYSHAGAPLVATMGAAVLYPINLLLLWLPFEQTFAWSAILRLWIAGASTYFLARHYRLGWQASLVASLCFMLSSFMVVWLGHPHTNVAIWLPGILLLDECLLTTSSVAKAVRYATLLAVLVGFQFTGGHAETSADLLVAATMYHVIRGGQLIARAERPLGSKVMQLVLLPGGAVLVGAGLAAIQLLPFLEWLPLSAEYHARAAASGFHFVPTDTWRYLLLLPLAIYPNLYGNPTWPMPPYRSLLPWGQNYNEDVLYVGTIPLILAGMALLAWRNRPSHVATWAILGGIALGRALQLPVFDWLNQLPVLSLGNPHRQRLVWCMSVAVLAGFGAEAWWNGCSERRGRLTRYWRVLNTGVVVLGGLVALMGAGLLPMLKPRLTAAARHAAELQFARTGTPPLSHLYARANEGVSKLLWSFRPANVSMYLPGLLSAAALVLTWRLLRGPLQRWPALRFMVVGLTAVDLMAFAWGYNPTVSSTAFYPTTAVTSTIARDSTLFRFSATGLDLIPDAQMMYDLPDIRSLDFNTRWFASYVATIPETNRFVPYGTTFDRFSSPLLQVLNLKYVFSTMEDRPTGTADAAVVLSTGSGRLWRLRSVQPRSFLVPEAVLARNDSEAARLLADAPAAVYHRVILSTPNVLLLKPSASSARAESSVRAIRYDAREAVWQVRTAEPSYMVTTDSYYPGWHAYIDGVETPVYRANIAFRAILLPAGEHRVVYRYEPGWLGSALLIEVISVSLIIAGLAWASVLYKRSVQRSQARSKAP